MNAEPQQPDGYLAYNYHPTIGKAHCSDAVFRLLTGPIGSGKTHGFGAWEMFFRGADARKYKGVRRSRFVAVRNTYRELRDTTIRTFEDVFPSQIRAWSAQDATMTVFCQLPDGSRMEMQILFRALDRPDDVKKLLSLELTGGFLNEARELPLEIAENLMGRIGRYPNKRMGGVKWSGIWGDTNKPTKRHWIYRKFEIERPKGWEIFHQPPAVLLNPDDNTYEINPHAENLENLPSTYYSNLLGNEPDWIKVMLQSEYGFMKTGQPIWPRYQGHVHHMDESYIPRRDEPIYCGIDFGLTPACIWGQFDHNGSLVAFAELQMQDSSASDLAGSIHKFNNQNLKGHRFIMGGDPAGQTRAQTDKKTPFFILQDNGLDVEKAPTNDFQLRTEAVDNLLKTMTMTGQPAFKTTVDTPLLHEAMMGGYGYKMIKLPGGDVIASPDPLKNHYSHIGDALQYMVLMAGVGYYGEEWEEAEDIRVRAR